MNTLSGSCLEDGWGSQEKEQMLQARSHLSADSAHNYKEPYSTDLFSLTSIFSLMVETAFLNSAPENSLPVSSIPVPYTPATAPKRSDYQLKSWIRCNETGNS